MYLLIWIVIDRCHCLIVYAIIIITVMQLQVQHTLLIYNNAGRHWCYKKKQESTVSIQLQIFKQWVPCGIVMSERQTLLLTVVTMLNSLIKAATELQRIPDGSSAIAISAKRQMQRYVGHTRWSQQCSLWQSGVASIPSLDSFCRVNLSVDIINVGTIPFLVSISRSIHSRITAFLSNLELSCTFSPLSHSFHSTY